MIMKRTYLLLCFVFCLRLGPSLGHVIGQQCDWTGSGLSGGEKRGVRPVYLRCREGTVSWSYPEGALRVLLRLGSSGGEFRACLRPAPKSALPASVYLEGPRSLNRLYPPLKPLEQPHVRCVQSRGGQVALYVEAATEPQISKQVIEFAYDLQPMAKNSVYDPYEECRPCSKEEMTQAFCTSELVTRGVIQRVVPVEDTDVAEITLKVSKTLRRWNSWGENDVLENSSSQNRRQEPDRETIQVGRHCGAQHGEGEMILMARRKLGQLVLTCAPRLEEWREVVKEAIAKDTAHCLLTS